MKEIKATYIQEGSRHIKEQYIEHQNKRKFTRRKG
jgi:hypothetical protein